MEDPIFEPWSLPPSGAAVSRTAAVERPEGRTEPVEFLRAVATPRLQSISRRLRLARHETALEDLLDQAPRLLRFELKPWPGPLARSAARGPAMLEIGLGPDADELVTAWCWLDRLGEAPQTATSIPATKLDTSWIERVILDFVGKALGHV